MFCLCLPSLFEIGDRLCTKYLGTSSHCAAAPGTLHQAPRSQLPVTNGERIHNVACVELIEIQETRQLSQGVSLLQQQQRLALCLDSPC